MQISDASTGAVLSTLTATSFQSGAYLDYAVSGNIVITITKEAGTSNVLSGLFLDPANTAPATATFLRPDFDDAGDWMGTYGGQGYDVIDGSSSLPSYAAITPWAPTTTSGRASTTDPRALQTSGGSSRIAATWWTTTSFAVDVNLTDGQVARPGAVLPRLGPAGADRAGADQRREHRRGAEHATASSFQSGAYLDYAVSGNIVITITKGAGTSNVLSGLFLDPAS